LIDIAFPGVEDQDLYPVVGIDTRYSFVYPVLTFPSDFVEFNFGQKPWKYNFEQDPNPIIYSIEHSGSSSDEFSSSEEDPGYVFEFSNSELDSSEDSGDGYFSPDDD
jgi:hypothetical protein